MKRFLSALLIMAAGAAFAHAELSTSNPAANAVLDAQPESIQLEFSEPLESAFSVFKVYPLVADVDLTADNANQRLAGLAGALVTEVLDLTDDAADRADTGHDPATGTTTEVTVNLVEDLPAGHYVVMWRALSIDTHVVQGFFVYSVE